MSSGGGGKGGGKKTTTETTVPEWVRAPADRNLQRAEALQQIEYMPYYGAQVAAFNDNQAAAFQNNNDAASAFGLLAPTDAMSSMPTPTTYANGMKGYSSIPLYDQAMKELTASNPDNMDAYNKLFGNKVPVNAAPQNSGGGGGGGGVSPRGGRDLTHAEHMAQTYAKVKTGDNTYGYTGQDERSTGGVNMSRAGINSGTSKPKVNYNVGGRNMRHTGGR